MAVVRPRIQNHRKRYAIVLSNEMTRRQKLKQHKVLVEIGHNIWNTFMSLDVSHNNKENFILACTLEPVLEKYLVIKKWGHYISPFWCNKLIVHIDYLRSTKKNLTVGSLKHV